MLVQGRGTLLLFFLLLDDLVPPRGLLLFQLLSLCLPERPDPVRRGGESADLIADVAAADQRGDNAGAGDEGQDETVHCVPGWGPAALGGARISVVEEVEGQELRDECGLGREQDGRPGNGGSDDTDGVAAIALSATVSCPFETPVDGAKERNDLEILCQQLRDLENND